MDPSSSNHPTSYSRSEIHGFDPDAFAEVIRGGAFDHRVLGAGRVSADLEHWESAGVSVDRGSYDFATLVEGEFRPGHLCFGLVLCPGEDPWINGARIQATNLQVYAEGAELLYRSGAGTNWTAVQVPRERLQQAALRRTGRTVKLPRSGMHNLRLAPGVVDRIRSLVADVLRDVRTAPDGVDSLPDVVLDGLVDALAHGGHDDATEVGKDSPRRVTAIRDSLRWMSAHVARGYDCDALCSAVGVPERTLQLYFRQCLRLSPNRAHLSIRLHEARRLLTAGRARASDSVTSTATRCGFGHLSRFAEDYRRLFGELPSETLRNRRSSRACGV